MRTGTRGPGSGSDEHVRRIIGRWIRQHREALGLSQDALRRRLRDRRVPVSQSTISRWERGDVLPPADVLPELARALGTTLQGYEEAVTRARTRCPADLADSSFPDLLQRAREATRTSRLYRAAACLEAALDLAALAQDPPPGELLAETLLLLAAVSLRLWHLDRAGICLRTLARLPGISPAQASLDLALRLDLARRRDDPVAAATLARTIGQHLRDDAPRARAIALSALATWHFAEERFADVPEPGHQGERLWRQLDDPTELSRLLGILAWSHSRLGRPVLASAKLREAESLAAANRDLHLATFLLRARGQLAADRGDRARAVGIFLDAATLARRLAFHEEEFVSAWHAWRLARGAERRGIARRLRKLLPAVSARLPEARVFRNAPSADGAARHPR